MAAVLDGLDADNREAWSLFTTLYCRLAVDLPGVAGAVLARVIEDRRGDEATDLLERLSLIYEIVCPPKPTTT